MGSGSALTMTPIPAVLTRIIRACQDANYHSPKLQQVLNDACMAMPGNLEQAKGNYDPSAYASEVIHVERLRVGFFGRVKEAFDEIELAAGDTIEWCLPFTDYDIYFINHDRFITGLKCFPNLECYLVVSDVNTPLANNWRNPRKLQVKIIDEATLQAMAPPLGFSSPLGPPSASLPSPGYGGIHGLPPAPAGGSMLPPYSSVPSEDDGEDEEEKPTPKPKRYRGIDDP